MPVTKQTKEFLAGAAREALLNALRATGQAEKSISKLAIFKARIVPNGYPPQFPVSPCEFSLAKKAKEITRKDFENALGSIEVWLGYLLKAYDKIYPKQPTRRKRTSRA